MIGPAVVGGVLSAGIVQSVALLVIKPWSKRYAAMLIAEGAQCPSCIAAMSSIGANPLTPHTQPIRCLGRSIFIRDIVVHW